MVYVVETIRIAVMVSVFSRAVSDMQYLSVIIQVNSVADHNIEFCSRPIEVLQTYVEYIKCPVLVVVCIQHH